MTTVTVTVPAAERSGSKVRGTFYPLQKAELLALKTAKLINNTAYVHFALRAENPFCDRPIEIVPQDFAREWSIPTSSVYEAIAKLKRKGLIAIETGKVILRWKDKIELEPESPPDPRNSSESSTSILNSQNSVSELRTDFEASENRLSEKSHSNNSTPSQTIQTNSNPSRREEKECNLDYKKFDSQLDCLAIDPKLRQKLARLKIPLDERVAEAIAKYYPSQIEIVLRHIENTQKTIKHPRSVFLHQLPKQKRERTLVTPPVKTARDFTGWTLGRLQKMYPTSWRQAAFHFGVAIVEKCHE